MQIIVKSYSPEDNCEGNTLRETRLQQTKLSTISLSYTNIICYK